MRGREDGFLYCTKIQMAHSQDAKEFVCITKSRINNTITFSSIQ